MKSASLSSLLLPLLLLGQLSLCASLKLTRRVAVGSAVGAAVSRRTAGVTTDERLAAARRAGWDGV